MADRPYLRIRLSPTEARTLSALARKNDRSVSDEIRTAVGLPVKDSATNPHRAKGHIRDGSRMVKIQLSEDERDSVRQEAAAAEATDRDYVRMALGLPRLRPDRVNAGAPAGNRNRTARRAVKRSPAAGKKRAASAKKRPGTAKKK